MTVNQLTLRQVIPDENKLLDTPVEVLAGHVLGCISAQANQNIRRRGLAMALLRDYPREHESQSLYAIEEALQWLERELFIGLDPVEREFVFITRRGRGALTSPEFFQCQPANSAFV
jgi:hypothetical protein